MGTLPFGITQEQMSTLKELATKYATICQDSRYPKLKEMWRAHNNLEKTRTPVLCCWHWSSNTEWSMFTDKCVNTDGRLLYIERMLRNRIFHHTIGDDMVFEPVISVKAVLNGPDGDWTGYTEAGQRVFSGLWGEKQDFIRVGDNWQAVPFIETVEDVTNKLKAVNHSVNEEATKEVYDGLCQIFEGTGISVSMDRRPLYISTYGGCDLSESLGKFIGIEKLFYFLYDKPEVIHALMSFMQKAVLNAFDQAEAAGDFQPDWELNGNLAAPYTASMPAPVVNGSGFQMKDLWLFTHAQEFALISAKMHKEFLLDYQLPILKKFGAVSYGCCEDLTKKITMLREIPNLRRVGMPFMCNIEKFAEQVKGDYLISWRPSTANVTAVFSEDAIRGELSEGIRKLNGSKVDIILKDVTAVGDEPERLKIWTDIAMEEAAKL